MMLRPSLLAFVLLFSGFLMASGCASTAPAVVESPEPVTAQVFDASEPLQILQTSAQDWSAGDIERFVSVYAEDCLFITSSGLTRGRAAVLSRYRQRYPNPQAMGTLQLEVLDVLRESPPRGRPPPAAPG